MKPNHQTVNHFKKIRFLRDILGIALTSFGGPQVHITIIHKKLIQKRHYLTEDELKELTSLCSMLPGPT